MRILVVSNLYPPVVLGGYERECGAVVDHLRGRHEVLVLTSRHLRDQAPREPGVLRTLPLLAEGPRGSVTAPVASVAAARRARAAIESFRPDLIYVWNGAGLPVAAIAAAGRSGVPVAFRVCEHWFGHIWESDQFARHLTPGDHGLRRAWAAGMRAFDRLPPLRLRGLEPFPATISWNSDFLRGATPVPPAVRPLLEETLLPALPQGDRFDGLPREPAERPTVAFVGRVSEDKGILVALEALALLRDEHGIEADLRVAGPLDARVAGAIEERLDGLRLRERVTMLGSLGEEGIAELLVAAHVMVVPPVWDEPAGLVCVEAALARVPLVAARSGGIPEIVRDGEEALLFDIGDAAGCAALLARVLNEPEEAAARAERAHSRGLELSWGPYVEGTDRFLARTAEAFGAGSGSGRSPIA